jgi:hypothetical protein
MVAQKNILFTLGTWIVMRIRNKWMDWMDKTFEMDLRIG